MAFDIERTLTSTQKIPNTANKAARFDKSRKFDNLAIALKTGDEVGLARTPIQFLTFLNRVNNVVMIGDSSEFNIGDVPMINVVGNSTNRLAKRSRDEVKPAEGTKGWKSDAYKKYTIFNQFAWIPRIVSLFPERRVVHND